MPFRTPLTRSSWLNRLEPSLQSWPVATSRPAVWCWSTPWCQHLERRPANGGEPQEQSQLGLRRRDPAGTPRRSNLPRISSMTSVRVTLLPSSATPVRRRTSCSVNHAKSTGGRKFRRQQSSGVTIDCFPLISSGSSWSIVSESRHWSSPAVISSPWPTPTVSPGPSWLSLAKPMSQALTGKAGWVGRSPSTCRSVSAVHQIEGELALTRLEAEDV